MANTKMEIRYHMMIWKNILVKNAKKNFCKDKLVFMDKFYLK